MGGFGCLIRCGTYLVGGALGTWRRELSLKILGPCDIHFGGWIPDLRTPRLRSIIHGCLVVDLDTYVEEKHWNVVTTLEHMLKNVDMQDIFELLESYGFDQNLRLPCL